MTEILAKSITSGMLFTLTTPMTTPLPSGDHTPSAYSNDREDFGHVVSGMLFDDGDNLTQLFEHVLSHVTVTMTNSMEKWWHHLREGERGRW